MNDNTQGSGEGQEQNQAPAQPAAPATKNRQQAPKAPAQAKQAEAQPKVAPRINIRNRHDVSFRHDVFMSSEEECVRNVGYEHLKPMLVKQRHKHVFHSHNNQGKKLSRTGSMLGHWHDVEHYVDANGDIKAKCGPPMHEVTIQDEETGLIFTRIEQVGFEELIKTGANAGKRVIHQDQHTHTLEYLGSEELNTLAINQKLKEERAEAAAMGINLGQGDVIDTTPKPMTPADGATIV